MPENSKQTNGSNPGVKLENLKQNKGIESGRDVGESETKRRDRIRSQFQRTRNKRRDSNPSAMLENPKQNEGIESGHNAREPETKEGIECFQRRK